MNLLSGKAPPKKADQPKINKIAVDGRGQITFNSEVVTVAQLKNTLQQLNSRSVYRLSAAGKAILRAPAAPSS